MHFTTVGFNNRKEQPALRLQIGNGKFQSLRKNVDVGSCESAQISSAHCVCVFTSLITQLCRALFKQITCYQKPPASLESSHSSSSCLSGFLQQTPMKGDTPRNERSSCRRCRKSLARSASLSQTKRNTFSLRLKQASSFKLLPNLHAYLSPLYLGLSLPGGVKDSGWHGIYFTYRCTRIANRRREPPLCFLFH